MCLIVIIDYLEKGLIFISLPNIKTNIVIRAFIRYIVAYY
jgi:hypothetical protein